MILPFMETAITSKFPHTQSINLLPSRLSLAMSARLTEQSNILSTTFQNTTRTSLVNNHSLYPFGITLAGVCLLLSKQQKHVVYASHTMRLSMLEYSRTNSIPFVCYLLEPLTFSSHYFSWLPVPWYINNEKPPSL